MKTDLPKDRHTVSPESNDLSAEHGIAYEFLPYGIQAGARRYVEDGVRPGKFLCAVLTNDFVGSMLRADHFNIPLLPNIARWLFNDLPESAWGSVTAVDAWIEQGGLHGKALREAKWLRGDQ